VPHLCIPLPTLTPGQASPDDLARLILIVTRQQAISTRIVFV
jgi:hypothetical protein